MLNLSQPTTFTDLGVHAPEDLIEKITSHCKRGEGMHQDSLKAVVLKLTFFSRDMNIRQTSRDEAAQLATHLANAAVKMYGSSSPFCREMIAGINDIMSRQAA